MSKLREITFSIKLFKSWLMTQKSFKMPAIDKENSISLWIVSLKIMPVYYIIYYILYIITDFENAVLRQTDESKMSALIIWITVELHSLGCCYILNMMAENTTLISCQELTLNPK